MNSLCYTIGYRNLGIYAWLLIASSLFIACDSSTQSEQQVVSLRIQTDDVLPILGVGQTIDLQVLASDQPSIVAGSVFEPKDVLWDSSDRSILTVSASGVVTSEGLGAALVSAQVEDVIDVMRIAVEPPYVLPFPSGAFRVIQAFGGSFSHTGSFFYSHDFVMPIGTPIVAARAGVVEAVEESFVDYDNTLGHENYVIVAHTDGTFARYLHLTENGVIPGVGDTVLAGDTLGFSGNTGFSTLPHLHFDVTERCALPLDACQTIEYWFANTSERQPRSGTTAAPSDQ